jgi:hypothetical protein
MRSFVLSIVLIAGIAGAAFADGVVMGRVTDLQNKPIAGARVHALIGTTQATTDTDKDGRYQISLAFTGEQELVVVVGTGTKHTYRHGKIQPDSTTTLDVELDTADGEIIRVIDSKPPTVPAKPRVTLPSSAAAVTAWLVLDIDEKGNVVRVKLVKRPGTELDEIAVREAMKLKFDAALDDAGKPMRSQELWAMEWPVEHSTTSKLPVASYSLDPFDLGVAAGTGKPSLRGVTCAGTTTQRPALRDEARLDVAHERRRVGREPLGDLGEQRAPRRAVHVEHVRERVRADARLVAADRPRLEAVRLAVDLLQDRRRGHNDHLHSAREYSGYSRRRRGNDEGRRLRLSS